MAKIYSSEFWSTNWGDGRIGFHRENVDSDLIKNFPFTNESEAVKRKVFVPLCDKSLDMRWIAERGHTVIGVEFVPQACDEFFSEQKLTYTTEKIEQFTIYQCTSPNCDIRIYCGDLFEYKLEMEGQFDFIWDRASLVAISPSDRIKYRTLMAELLKDTASYLLNTIWYEEGVRKPPPNSMSETVVKELLEPNFNVEYLGTRNDSVTTMFSILSFWVKPKKG